MISFAVFLVFRVPIAVALGLSCLLGLAVHPMASSALVAQRMFVAIDSFPLLAVPLYMLAGYLMSTGGISRRIIEFASSIVGNWTGGLAHVNILASMIFGGISGSAVADTAGIGTLLIPAMTRRGYARSYAAAVTAVSSTLGIVIPPSIPMVIIGSMLGVSVGKLFLGGLIPGLLIGAGLMAVAGLMARRHGGRETEAGLHIRAILTAFRRAFWALLLPVLIIVGIVGGVVTPSEAGGAAVAYAFLVGAFVYRELTWTGAYEALVNTVLGTGRVFFLIATAGLYAWLLTANGFPAIVGDLLASVTSVPAFMLVLIVLIFLVVTTFMESIAAMILLLPMLYPVVQQVGIDPIHFGVLVVMSIGVGLVTPPVGLCLYVAAGIAEADIGSVCRVLAPFVLAMLVLLVLCIVFPRLVTTVPELLMK